VRWLESSVSSKRVLFAFGTLLKQGVNDMRTVDLKIEDVAFGGKGVARENGKAVFIPFTIENRSRQRSRARKSNLPKRSLSIFVRLPRIASNRLARISGSAAVAPTNTSITRTSSRLSHAKSTTFSSESENLKTFRCVQSSPRPFNMLIAIASPFTPRMA